MTVKETFFLQNDDEDEAPVDFMMESDADFRPSDDGLIDPQANRRIQVLLESITRIGGEVSKLRADVDGLLDQNQTLLETFDKLKEVLAEKGTIDLDDFDLACEVLDANTVPLNRPTHRKLAN
jgi:hypothetical protein